MGYETMLAEIVHISGYRDEIIEAYSARPIGEGPLPGVVMIHHMPGFDEASKEIARRFASHGYQAICPNLYSRESEPDLSPEEVATRCRDQGGVTDERMVGDVEAAIEDLRTSAGSNGKVGVIGFCSGGRQAFIAAAKTSADAVVDCYGGGVISRPDQITPARPVPAIDLTPEIDCPLLCLFGKEDSNPSPEHAAMIEGALTANEKTYETHSYDGAGHGFFSVERNGGTFNIDAARDGWERVFDFFGRYLTET